MLPRNKCYKYTSVKHPGRDTATIRPGNDAARHRLESVVLRSVFSRSATGNKEAIPSEYDFHGHLKIFLSTWDLAAFLYTPG